MVKPTNITAVIYAGGQGSRLYPLTSETKPKPVLNLVSNRPIIDDTLQRAFVFTDKKIVVTSQETKQIILDKTTKANLTFLVEPEPKGTLGVVKLVMDSKHSKTNVLVFMPSDHCIPNQVKLTTTILKAAELAKSTDKIVVVGVEPTSPDTNKGYILPIQFESDNDTTKLNSCVFFEKPTLNKSKTLIKNNALWNTGILVATPNTIKKALGSRLMRTPFSKLPDENNSIDKAVLEHSTDLRYVKFDSVWYDIGTPAGLFKALDQYTIPNNMNPHVEKVKDTIIQWKEFLIRPEHVIELTPHDNIKPYLQH